MKTHPRLFRCTWYALIPSIGLCVAGCNKEPGTEVSQQNSRPRAAKSPSKPGLQAEVDKLRQLPVERIPGGGPLIVSERAGNARDWVEQALRTGYLQTGPTNSQWDAHVFAAFREYSDYSRKLQYPRFGSMTNAIHLADAAGCQDPMIRYMNARYCVGDHNNTDEKYAIALVQSFQALMTSQHHPGFKFMAGYRAIIAARQADGNGNRAPLQKLVNVALEDFARDSNAPPAEVFQFAFEWMNYTPTKGWTDFALTNLDGILEANWPNNPELFRLRGTAEVRRAWESRGGSWANTVSDEGWQGFREHLDKAEEMLVKSWGMNHTNAQTAYEMMRVELGQGRGRQRMDQWFRRAMALYTNYYDAAELMSFYLEPRWYGSEGETLEFARSCVTNKNWGGNVPLVLPQLHHSLARYYNKAESPDYWQQSWVWPDVRSGYERFFQLNPSEYSWRHNYARDAYLCGHYDVFLAQVKLFSGGTNYTFFGGKAKFEEMLRNPSANVARPGK